MNIIDTNESKRHRLTIKSFEDKHSIPQIQTSTNSRMKRKSSLINSAMTSTPSKKLDAVKSTEFELRDHKQTSALDSEINDSNVNPNSSSHNDFSRESDVDDYADRIFDYLGEAYTKQSRTTTLPTVEINPINSASPSLPRIYPSEQEEIKPFLCAFCPYFALDLHEFQTHIAKHTEKNFRCLLCNCMYKYRRDCVTHMKRKHSYTVTGSISQYIQKINGATTTNKVCAQPTSTPPVNTNTSNAFVEPKRYGCPYCSLMTKSTSSIYKHQSRKHASFPKIVHKYSTDDPTTRSLVAILKQKSIKKPTNDDEQVLKLPDEPLNTEPSNLSSSSTSLAQHHNDSTAILIRQRCAASKHITSHGIHASNGRLSKVFQCSLCDYRAHHRSNVVRHVKKTHSMDFDELDLSPVLPGNGPNSQSIENLNQSDENSDKSILDYDEEKAKYSFSTTVQTPLVFNQSQAEDHPNKTYADIHLSINIFLPKKKKSNSFERMASDCSQSDGNALSEDDTSDDERTNIHVSTSNQPSLSCGSLYKPHKCRRCFYRSNWKTDMLHHIRLKHHINHATKSDYISMDFNSALHSFANYEQTFGKVLKNRLLLPKIDYIDCTWEELKSKLYLHDEQTKINQQSTVVHQSLSSMNTDEEKSLDRQSLINV